MSQIIVTVIGGIVGSFIPGVGTKWGLTAGAFIGSWLYPPESPSTGGLPKIANLQITAAQKGQVLPIVYGKTRIPGTVIWYGNFTSIVSGGEGGKKAPPTSTTITYTAGLAIALCEGRASGFHRMWAGEDEVPLASFVYGLHQGLAAPVPDPYVQAHLAVGQPDLSYPYVCYLVLQDWGLGTYPSVPNFTFEISRTTFDINAANPSMTTLGLNTFLENADDDMNPVYCLVDFLTDSRYGLGIPTTMVNAESFQVLAQWCEDSLIFCSPVLDQSQDGIAHIEHLLSYFDGILIFSEGFFKLRARHSPVYEALGYAPIDWRDWLEYPKFAKPSLRGVSNVIALEYRDRASNYNVSLVERKDDWDVGSRGQYREQIALGGITTGDLADRTASKLLWARVVAPFTVELKLGPRAVWYEPGDVLSVKGSDAYNLGDTQLRIVNIREESTGVYLVTAVEER